MTSDDADLGIEGYLYESEKADYLNINQRCNDSELSLVTDDQPVRNSLDGGANEVERNVVSMCQTLITLTH